MSPSKMTDKEKTIWKVEILKHSEDMDDLIDEKIKQIKAERQKITDCMEESKNLIDSYDTAVDRIGMKYKRVPADYNKYEQLINSANQPSQKKKTMPIIESTDLDQSHVGGRPKVKVGLLQFKKNLNMGINNNEQSRSARTASISGRSTINQTLEIPEVFNRLYKQEQLKHCCAACKEGPCDHNKPDKPPSNYGSQRSGSKRSNRSSAAGSAHSAHRAKSKSSANRQSSQKR